VSLYKAFGKRGLDLAAAGAALILLSPLLLMVAAAVAIKLGRPVLFAQQRTGWKKRPFRILKFRSMLDARDPEGRPLPDEQRLTRFGSWLRAWSLDELPSLINILRGEMSLVGPRPLLPQYDELYTPKQARRFEVRPGVTGWAQVNGRNAIGWSEKFAYDRWYVDHQSFALDLKILAITVARVLSRHGINSSEAATMPLFRGAPDEPEAPGEPAEGKAP
jgi:lipopolysaccharide/colanic/teichoic acid biosynthesis glycosyltransferase